VQIRNLIDNISDMPDDELRARLTEIRNKRLQAPDKVKKAAKTKAKSEKSQADKIMSGMSKDDISKLLEKYKK